MIRGMLEALRDARQALDQLLADTALQARMSLIPALLARSMRSGGKVLVCGNGGSSADAMHFAEELTGRFKDDRPALPALACTDAGHITCTANDYGWEMVFSRWVEALGRAGDVLVVLSTSGNSPNIVRAVHAAGERGLTTIALLGGDGGRVSRETKVDHGFVFPGATTDRIQELHMIVLHAWVAGVEREMFSARA